MFIKTENSVVLSMKLTTSPSAFLFVHLAELKDLGVAFILTKRFVTH